MKQVLYILLLGTLIGCNSSKKPVVNAGQKQQIKEQIRTKEMTIIATWAYPLSNNVLNQLGLNNGLGAGNSGSRINLLGDNHTVTIHNDSIKGYLPYYGERRMGGGYNSSNAVTFNGIARDYKVTTNDKKKRTEINFTIADGTESYDVHLEIYTTGRASIALNSTHRTSIRYDGELVLDND